MNYTRIFTTLLAVALFLALAPAALASTWYVDGVNGNDNNNCKSWKHACQTIGRAISLASSGDTIKVAPATYTENLTIGISLNIIGADATTTIVDGNQADTVVTSPYAANGTLSNLTVRNGNGYYGGGIYFNAGTLAVTNSIISGNTAFQGGGVYANDHLFINKSTISGNSATEGPGGISGGVPPMTITNSTISGNTAAGGCGGTGGIATINNSTISGNGAGDYSGGNICAPFPGVTIQNSIVANATSGGNCWADINSEGYNLSDDNTCNFNGPGDLNNTKAKLGTLGYHGGPTPTIPEMPGSPTVDAGNPSGCTYGNGKLLKTDQRGKPRPGAHKTHKICDMGAYERQTD